jgi:hypothetical protein
MRGSGCVLGAALAALLATPGAAFAVTVNPDRLDGSFDFVAKDEPNNQLTFVIDGETNGIAGQVTGNSGTDLVVISYFTTFPSKVSANEKGASLTQDRQVIVRLELIPGEGSSTPAYFGEAAPGKCKAQAKIRDNEVNDPDDPDKSQATLRCDLGSDFQALDDDEVPETPGDPPAEVLQAVEAAFDSRKDVKLRISRGSLQIKHNGEPVPTP